MAATRHLDSTGTTGTTASPERTPISMTTAHAVRDVMTTEVISVTRRTGFKEIAQLLHTRGLGAVPVLDDQGMIAGIVSQGDLLPKEAYHDRVPTRREMLLHLEEIEKAGGTTAGDVMTVPVAVIGPHAPLGEAARLMARHHVRTLPVVDGRGTLMGIISRSDLLKVFLATDEQLTATVVAELALALPGSDTSRLTFTVQDGRVTIGGALDDTQLVPALARLTRGVEGVVDVEVSLDHPHPHRVGPPPDFAALY